MAAVTWLRLIGVGVSWFSTQSLSVVDLNIAIVS